MTTHRSRIVPQENGCWLWTGTLSPKGYGSVTVEGRQFPAHRLAWILHRGPIPAGLELDHLCRNRACVNPDHLEPVTHEENIRRSPVAIAAINARKTHCKNGHPFTPENTRYSVSPNGKSRRSCRECERGWTRAYQQRRRAEWAS